MTDYITTTEFASDRDKAAPHCDKCGAEITTGLMAAFCELGKECEFWTPAVDEFMADFEPDDRPEDEPYCICGNEPIEDEEASNVCSACGKPLA